MTEFISTTQDFSSHVRRTYLRLALVIPLITLFDVAVFHHLKGKPDAIQGFQQMNFISFILPLVISVLILICLIVFLKTYYKNREIVIQLKFDEQRQELIVKTKTISGQEFNRAHNYKELSVKRISLSDGMTPPMYNTITLLNGGNFVGHIFQTHFIWDKETFEEIRLKLKILRGGNKL